MQKTVFVLEAKRQLTCDIYELKFSGDTGAITACGQFVNIEIEGCYLRRPISVCDSKRGELTLICRTVGEGTTKLCASDTGAKFDMLTGLGNGYNLEEHGIKPILVGGGAGVPPLYLLAEKLIEVGVNPTVALGFGRADDVFYVDEFRALGCTVLVSTIDGLLGDKGLVTDIIKKYASDCDYVFCCGPEPMLKAVYDLEQIKGGQFSFEERMGCGFGACMGCSCKTKYGYKRICKDGPVLKKEEIIW
ncbi:MAG: dihydroorotate dehydrogenase electron transfer subunit [Oscillospiraceae bacterium]